MRGQIRTFDGKCYDMPALLRYELKMTGSVPCDSFSVQCAYSAQMAQILPDATRFAALDGETLEFFGVVDDYEVSCGEGGMTLTLNGRGIAALLLDSESEAGLYENAAMEDILAAKVQPLGIACTLNEAGNARFSLETDSGASFYSVLASAAKKCGARPHFTKEGTLEIRKSGAGERRLTAATPLIAALYREKRYGVISEITLIDRESGAKTGVKNEEFLSRGGLCRRVLYAAKGDASSYLTGRERIEQSMEDARVLRVTLAGKSDFCPMDRVEVSLGTIGIAGKFRVSEVERRGERGGEVTELTLQGV